MRVWNPVSIGPGVATVLLIGYAVFTTDQQALDRMIALVFGALFILTAGAFGK